MIDRKKLFDEPVKNDLRTYENIRKTATVRRIYYTTSCLLEYAYFKECLSLL